MIASAKPEVEVACSTSPVWRATSRVTACPSSSVTKDGVLDALRGVRLAEVAQHHHALRHERRRVDDVLAGVLGRRAVDGLEDGDVVAVVAGSREAQAADEAGGEVADDVAGEVGGDDDVELRGVLDHLVRDVVDDEVLRLDLRVLGRELLEDALEQALGELEDVRLRGAGDLARGPPGAPARRRSG